MPENKSDRIAILLHGHEQAYKNFYGRWSYEWKLSFGIWTALAAFIALSVRQTIILSPLQCWLLAGVGAMVFIMQWYYLMCAHRASDVSKNRAHFYEKLLLKASCDYEAMEMKIRPLIKKAHCSPEHISLCGEVQTRSNYQLTTVVGLRLSLRPTVRFCPR